MKSTVGAALFAFLLAVSQVPFPSMAGGSPIPAQDGTKEKAVREWIIALGKDTKDATAIKGMRSLDPSQLPIVFKIAAEALEPSTYCAVSPVIETAFRESLDSAIDTFFTECKSKRDEWAKDPTVFRKHTRWMLTRVNYLADLDVLYNQRTVQSQLLIKTAESIAIETDPHPISLYGELAQCKVLAVLGPEYDRTRRKIAAGALETIEKRAGQPGMAEQLKECNLDDLRAKFAALGR